MKEVILKNEVKSYTEARKIVFDKIYSIIEENSYYSFTYEILGYPYQSTKLVLRFSNHFQIFEFAYMLNRSITLKEFRIEFTDEQELNNIKDFSTRFNSYEEEDEVEYDSAWDVTLMDGLEDME